MDTLSEWRWSFIQFVLRHLHLKSPSVCRQFRQNSFKLSLVRKMWCTVLVCLVLKSLYILYMKIIHVVEGLLSLVNVTTTRNSFWFLRISFNFSVFHLSYQYDREFLKKYCFSEDFLVHSELCARSFTTLVPIYLILAIMLKSCILHILKFCDMIQTITEFL